MNNDNPTSKLRPAPIFVVGAWRSGTTILRLMLNRHSRIAIPTESHFVVGLYRRFWGRLDPGKFQDALRKNPFLLRWQLDEEVLLERLQAAERTWRGQFDAVFDTYARMHSKPRWGDKTPDYVLNLGILHRIFPDLQVIHVIRDGRDVACSLADVPWFSEDIRGAAHGWRKRVVRGINYGKRLGAAQYCEVRYEDLVNNPREQVQTLCSFLGETFEPEMLTFYEDANELIPADAFAWHQRVAEPIVTSRIGRWRDTLPSSEVARFEQIAGDMLGQLGYDTVSKPAWGWTGGRITGLSARFGKKVLRRIRRYIGMVRR